MAVGFMNRPELRVGLSNLFWLFWIVLKLFWMFFLQSFILRIVLSTYFMSEQVEHAATIIICFHCLERVFISSTKIFFDF